MSQAWVAGSLCIKQSHALDLAPATANLEAASPPSPVLTLVLSLTDHEAILITLLLIFLLFLPALVTGIYFWYRRENSLLNKWIKEMRRRSQETYEWVIRPKFSLLRTQWDPETFFFLPLAAASLVGTVVGE